MIHNISSIESMQSFAGKLASMLIPGDILLLEGDFGVGKTTLCKEIIKIKTGMQASSPSFQMIQEYKNVIHCDFYNLSDLSLALEKGLDLWSKEKIVVIEWPELIKPYLIAYYLVKIEFSSNSNNDRIAMIYKYNIT